MARNSMTTGWIAMLGGLIVAALLVAACDVEESDFVASINGSWESTAAEGDGETLRFEQDQVHWANKAQGEYACPFRVRGFDEKARTIDISTICQKRTGTTLPVMYSLRLTENRREFSLLPEDRVVGVYRAGQ
jgi:hypothetical protein